MTQTKGNSGKWRCYAVLSSHPSNYGRAQKAVNLFHYWRWKMEKKWNRWVQKFKFSAWLFFLTWISQFLSPHFRKIQLEATKKANFLRLWNKQKRKHWTDVTKWRNGKKTKKNWTENKRRRLRKSSQEKFKSRRFIDVREPLLFSSVTWPLPTLFRVENVSHLFFFLSGPIFYEIK